jgi:hypothetical protein
MKRNRITQHRVLSKEILEVEPNEFSTIVFCFGIDKMKKCSERAPKGRARDFNIMRKKIIILVIAVLVIVAAGGGVFWWQRREIKGSPKDYVIKETPEGKIVENKRAGLRVKVPEGWEAKRVESLKEGSLIIQTSNIEGEKRDGVVTPPLKEGCGIETTVSYKTLSLEEIKEEAKKAHWMLVPISEEFEEVTINNRKALKNIWESKATGPMITFYIPTVNKVYTFTLTWATNEKETCIQKFEKFLETISIR